MSYKEHTAKDSPILQISIAVLGLIVAGLLTAAMESAISIRDTILLLKPELSAIHSDINDFQKRLDIVEKAIYTIKGKNVEWVPNSTGTALIPRYSTNNGIVPQND